MSTHNSHADHRTKHHSSLKKNHTPNNGTAPHDERTRAAAEEEAKTGKKITPATQEEVHTRNATPNAEEEAGKGAGGKKTEGQSAFDKIKYGINIGKDVHAFHKGYHEKGKDGGVRGAFLEGGHETLDNLVSDALNSSKETHLRNFRNVGSETLKPHKEFWSPVAEKAKQGFNRIVHGKAAAPAVVAGEHAKEEASLGKRLMDGARGKLGEYKEKFTTSEGRGKLFEGGVNSAGRAGLANSFQTVSGDAIKYYTGKRAFTPENGADTTVRTLMALDPIHGLASSIPIKGTNNISIEKAASYLYGYHGQTLSEMGNETVRTYQQANDIHAGLAYHRKPKTSKAPSVYDYDHLAAVAPQVARFVPGGKIDGHDVARDFRHIDMTKSRNYNAYNIALLQAINEQDRIMHNNSSDIPRNMRSGAGADRYNNAEVQSSYLSAAQEEMGLYMGRIHAYNREQAMDRALEQAAVLKKGSGHPGHAQGQDVDHANVVPVHGLPHTAQKPKTIST